MEYEVSDPKGIHVSGRHVQKGRTVALPDGAALKAFLHFKQVSPRVEEKKPEKPAETVPHDNGVERPKK
jgi:hypothetical protein